MAEGKQHAIGIGITKMSAAEMYQFFFDCPDDIHQHNRKSINKGVAIELIHYVCDGLWNYAVSKGSKPHPAQITP